jgi:hypothetical protein
MRIDMKTFNIDELKLIKNNRVSRKHLETELNKMLTHSNGCRAIVESLNRKTGEYRIILQGTLVKEN